ncbi:GyrI-like domain-containing protein [Paenibacillus sedimenti]|uniref:Effector binding domain-containing protein n=1 Tax=Paenibacillus sedimenti TaxID=2770274 RepID=A0A926KU50_9BACL|nr:effector binding domain-containing protein [Paenibacillus sedimenti]MBD0382283.1 effector binding domain-containing protein [Paenibacillus sedimenti]
MTILHEAKVELLALPQIHMIGIPVTCTFEGDNKRIIEETKKRLLARLPEISNALHPERYVCPHFAAETMFTYIISLEVSDLSHIPEGMMGYTLPAYSYAKTRCSGDPYEAIHTYLQQQGLHSKAKALAFEVYHVDNPKWPEEVDVYVPYERK